MSKSYLRIHEVPHLQYPKSQVIHFKFQDDKGLDSGEE